MTTKSDFSAAEWEILRNAPNLVVLAMAVAEASGFFGSIAESMAPTTLIREVLQGDNLLLKEICQKEEMQASIDAIRDLARESGDFAGIKSALRREAVDKARAAIALLQQKGTPEEVAAYRDLLFRLGETVANAAKEGGFMGFGGERISGQERVLLDELAEALGMLQA